MKCTACGEDIDNLFIGDYISGIIFNDASISIDLCEYCANYFFM